MSSTSKHPKGLFVLFFTEFWERFGYYLLIGIFSLYMLDSKENGGMGFSKGMKSDVYGTYLGLVYLTPFIGGLLADRILGYRKAIVMGGLMMAAGYFCLSISGEKTFFAGLFLIILGNGFFKPNISTLVGNLYNTPQYIDNKDAGFNIFYMGINLGAFVCNFVAAFMRNNYGWSYAFIAAGVGMFIGVIWFLSGTKHIKHADVIKPTTKEDMPIAKILLTVFVPVFIFGFLGWMIPGNIFGTDSNDAFLIGCIPVIFYYGNLYFKASAEDKKGIGALLAVFSAVIIFWAIFHQNGDALTEWADNYTDRSMGDGVATAANKLGMTKTVTFNGDSTDKTSAHYFSNLSPDQIPPAGKSLKLYSTELFQSVNPFWVVILTPVVVGFFGWLGARRKKPISTPTKITLGLLITALSCFVMVGAVMASNNGAEKASPWWLIASYGVITIGELCLSPMGLSLVSKLSPPRLTALMMGGWFLAVSVGNKLSGILSSTWEHMENKANFFLMNFGLVFLAFLLMAAMLKWLNRIMKEKGLN